MMAGLRSALFTILGMAVPLVIALVGAEFAVRWIKPELDPSGQVEFISTGEPNVALGRPNAVHRQIKNTGDFDVTVRFDRFGFRESKDIATMTPQDWVMVGDSLPFGWGVEEPQRISNQLESMTGQRVFNLSLPIPLQGWSALLRLAQANGAKPGKLLIAFSAEARLIDYTPVPASTASGGSGGGLMTAKVWLMGHSALYFLATSAVHANPAIKAKAIQWGLINPDMEGFPSRAYSAKAVETSVQAVKVLAATLPRALVAVFPSRGCWLGPHQDDERRMHDDFVAGLKAAGLDVVDLRPTFEAGGAPLDHYFRHDGHWNAGGHQLAAKVVASALR